MSAGETAASHALTDPSSHRMLDALMAGPESDFLAELANLEREGLLRRPVVVDGDQRIEGRIDGRPVVVFCSNDYLGLASHPDLLHAARHALEATGIGGGASRLVSGTHPVHLAAERTCAAWVGLPSALLFSSGYAANVGALSTVLGRGDVAFSDALNHASLIDGLRLSRADVHVYPHRDIAALESALASHRASGKRAWIITDAVFSMDGALAPLRELRALADRYEAGLYVDEAHAIGLLGDGRGACAELDVRPDALLGTLGKAAGVGGAFVAGSDSLRRLLENRARGYVFSTAVPPLLAAIIQRAAELAAGAHHRRRTVEAYVAQLRTGLRDLGWDVPDGRGAILPVIVGEPARTMALSSELLRRGIFVQGIRPPTVPAGTSRLRIVPTAGHRPAHVRQLLDAMGELRA